MAIDPEKKIAQARVALMFRYPFFGYFAVTLELVKDEDLSPPTMATDGKKLYYHPAFVDNVTLDELKGVIVHEIGHIILRHPAREGGRGHEKWNEACDYATNALVLREVDSKGEPLRLPEGILYNKDFEEKTAEWIYEQLPDNPAGSGGTGSGSEEPGPGSGKTVDSHQHWDKWGKKSSSDKGEDDKGEGQSESDGDGYDDSFEQELREKIAQAAHQAQGRGMLPGHLAKLVENALQPKLNWKVILRDMITSVAKCDYRLVPPNKKYMWSGIYLPSLSGEEIKVAYGIDASGSISMEMIKQEIAEIKGICSAYEKFTIYGFVCDTRISQRFEIHEFDPIPEIRLTGGGTSFIEPLTEAAKLDISCFIYATDLDGAYPPRPFFPVIWLKVGNYDKKPPYGTVIEVKDG